MPSEMTKEQREQARQQYRQLADALRAVPTAMLASTRAPLERPKAVVRAAQVFVGAVDSSSVSRVADTLQRLVAQVAALGGEAKQPVSSPRKRPLSR